jgi:hypothetical protein
MRSPRKRQDDRSLVFISHITEEREIAIAFKDLVEASFLGLIDVFVSSDEDSITMGERWLDSITDALKRCKVEVILCSPLSVTRPWINFEAGAGWVRGVPVIPLCHSEMTPAKLPIPLKLLLAARATETTDLRRILTVLAQAIGAQAPTVDLASFIQLVERFEEVNTFWNKCNEHFALLDKVHPFTVQVLKRGGACRYIVGECDYALLETVRPFFEEHELLQLRIARGTVNDAYGKIYECIVVPEKRLKEILNDPNFRH